MSWFIAILRELFAVFVDDLAYAVSILAIIAVTGCIVHAFAQPAASIGIGLLAGLVVVLFVGTVMKARTIARSRAGQGRRS